MNSESAVDGDVACTSSILSYVRLSVTEGKYRMVRRVLHNAGHSVLLLHRRSFGVISLSSVSLNRQLLLWPPPSELQEGQIRVCTQLEEIGMLGLLKK
ncbi:hypothetical protein EON65_41425 [archaeon]|nr:MAG: hypothetical protein EON65_41425 [archaeon]